MTTSYADYTYYTDTYLGSSIASADFAALALRASAIIDRETYRRAEAVVEAGTDADTINLLSMACCALADKMQELGLSAGNDAIQSERVGNHSVTYAGASYQMLTTEQKYENVLLAYLGDTGLMFRGFYNSEYGSEPLA